MFLIACWLVVNSSMWSLKNWYMVFTSSKFKIIEWNTNFCFFSFSIGSSSIILVSTNSAKNRCNYSFLLFCNSINLPNISPSQFNSSNLNIFTIIYIIIIFWLPYLSQQFEIISAVVPRIEIFGKSILTEVKEACHNQPLADKKISYYTDYFVGAKLCCKFLRAFLKEDFEENS